MMSLELDEDNEKKLDHLIEVLYQDQPSDKELSDATTRLANLWKVEASDARFDGAVRPERTKSVLNATRVASWASLAIAVVVVVSIGIGIFATPRITFAQVQEQIRNALSVKMTLEYPEQSSRNCEIKRMANGNSRNDFRDGSAHVYIAESKEGRAYNARSKTTWKLANIPAEASPWDFIEKVLKLNDTKTIDLGRRVVRGVDCQGFKPILNDDFAPTIWVDVNTRLPKRLEQIYEDRLLSSQSFTIDFDFNSVQEREILHALPSNFAEVPSGPLFPALDPNIDIASKTELHPGIGIGPISFGDSIHTVIDHYGPPSELYYHYDENGKAITSSLPLANHSLRQVQLVYAHFGLHFFGDSKELLEAVHVDSHLQSKPKEVLLFHSADGIRIHSPWTDVIAKYGEPDGKRGEEDEFAVHFKKIGMEFEIVEKRVTVIVLKRKE